MTEKFYKTYKETNSVEKKKEIINKYIKDKKFYKIVNSVSYKDELLIDAADEKILSTICEKTTNKNLYYLVDYVYYKYRDNKKKSYKIDLLLKVLNNKKLLAHLVALKQLINQKKRKENAILRFAYINYSEILNFFKTKKFISYNNFELPVNNHKYYFQNIILNIKTNDITSFKDSIKIINSGCLNDLKCKKIDFPNVRIIEPNNFNNCDCEIIDLPRCNIIRNNCFNNLKQITKLELPAIVNIENKCFMNCEKLNYIKLEKCELLGENTFYKNFNLKNVILPSMKHYPVCFKYNKLNSLNISSELIQLICPKCKKIGLTQK